MNNKPRLMFKGQPFISEDPEAAFAISLGHLLGDGCIRKYGKRMTVEQSLEGYVEWKHREMRRLGLVGPNSTIMYVVHKRTDKKTGEVTEKIAYRFETRSLYEEWDSVFYVSRQPGDPAYKEGQAPRRRKRFPQELVSWFNHPLALAVFYMDDGGVQDNQPYFATGEVSEQEVLYMQQALKENFGFETSIRYAKKVAVGLLVRRKSCPKFMDLVVPYVNQVPCMCFKLKIT